MFGDLSTRKWGLFWVSLVRKRGNLVTGHLNTFSLGGGMNGVGIEMSLEKKPWQLTSASGGEVWSFSLLHSVFVFNFYSGMIPKWYHLCLVGVLDWR